MVGVGLVAVCVAETISELVQLWTVPNAVYYYVKYFVDTEAAWVVTGLYWYSYAAIFAVQMLSAAKLVQFWDLTAIWPPFIFYLMVPIVLLSINLAGIRVYGWTETVFGMLKTILIFGVICALYDISTKSELPSSLHFTPPILHICYFTDPFLPDNYAGPSGRKHHLFFPSSPFRFADVPPSNIRGTTIQQNFYDAIISLLLVTRPLSSFLRYLSNSTTQLRNPPGGLQLHWH